VKPSRLTVVCGSLLALSSTLIVGWALYARWTTPRIHQAAAPAVIEDEILELDTEQLIDPLSEEITIELDTDVDFDLSQQLVSDQPLGRLSSSDPSELQFSCAVCLDSREQKAAACLQYGSPEEQVKAALALWRAHSRRYADKVLEYVSRETSSNQNFHSLKGEVEGSLTSEAIRQEMQTGDYAWGVWLAFLRPHADLVPELLADLETKPKHRPALILSLGKSKDERAFEPLLKLLQADDYQTPGWAAKGLKYLADPRAEPHLIEAASAEGNGWKRIHACDALADLGTAAAIPTLESIANDDRYTGALGVRRIAQSALQSVRDREAR
jgi:hypothetical protein